MLIHTGRPEVWLPLCDPDARISVAGATAPHREPTLIVADGESQEIAGGQRGRPGVPAWITRDQGRLGSGHANQLRRGHSEHTGDPAILDVLMRPPRNEAQCPSTCRCASDGGRRPDAERVAGRSQGVADGSRSGRAGVPAGHQRRSGCRRRVARAGGDRRPRASSTLRALATNAARIVATTCGPQVRPGDRVP